MYFTGRNMMEVVLYFCVMSTNTTLLPLCFVRVTSIQKPRVKKELRRAESQEELREENIFFKFSCVVVLSILPSNF